MRSSGTLRIMTLVTLLSSSIWTDSLNAQNSSDSSRFEQQIVSFFNRYCVDCHSSGAAEGGVVLDEFRTPEDIFAAGKTWLRVLEAVDRNLMPPGDAAQPTTQQRQLFSEWIEEQFLSTQCGVQSSASAVVIRRLNRQEYDNTLRDLMGLEMELSSKFPADDIGFGFDNIGSALNVSPVHLEKYLDAAEVAMQSAIVLPDVERYAPIELIGLRTYPLPEDEPVEFEHHLAPGRYLADFSLVRAGISESVPPPRLVIGFGKDRRTVEAVQIQDETVVYRYWLSVAENDKQVYVSLAQNQEDLEPLDQFLAPDQPNTANVSGDQRYGKNHGLHVDSMVVRGPVAAHRDDLPESHRRIFVCQPGFGDDSRLSCAQKIIHEFTQKAYRRPVSESEVVGLMKIFQRAHYRGESFERAIQVALSAVLISPHFLYLVEPSEGVDEDRQLNEYELANRLSYFLWSTMPDNELLNAAEQNSLREQLETQVHRMLEDPKSDEFVANFVGQWLQLRNLEGVRPDTEMFPSFDAELREAMRAETEMFFSHVLRNNRSILELLDAPYTFLNDKLAEHYGIRNVVGDQFRMVEMLGEQRGGVLTQASILTLTSHHTRTSPVKRGQWVLQQLLGTPPPPPPPGVSELDESPQATQSASLRDRLELHRANPECASCHNQMDPMGFALENYDAIGRWRTRDSGFTIDPSGILFGQHNFEDARQLKELLKATESKKFSWCLIENMLTYGLGRALEPQDYCTVEAIRRSLVDDHYRIQRIVMGIVESNAFQRRGVK